MICYVFWNVAMKQPWHIPTSNLKLPAKSYNLGPKNVKIYIFGKTGEELKCQPLFVENWTENVIEDTNSGTIRIEDSCDGEDIM